MLSLKARLISFLVGIAFLGLVSFLVRRRKIYNIYAITWFLFSLLFIIMGVFPTFVETLASMLGIYFTPAAIIVVAVGGTMAIVLHLSIIVSEQHKQIRQFEKEIALLKKESPEHRV